MAGEAKQTLGRQSHAGGPYLIARGMAASTVHRDRHLMAGLVQHVPLLVQGAQFHQAARVIAGHHIWLEVTGAALHRQVCVPGGDMLREIVVAIAAGQ